MQGVTTVPKKALMLEKKFPHWTQESSNKLIMKFELLLTYEWQPHMSLLLVLEEPFDSQVM